MPTLSIVTPAANQTLTGDQVAVKVAVANFTLVDYKTHPRPVAGLGHVHLWLDQAPAVAGPVTAVKVVSGAYTFAHVPTGDHTLVAELVANDHSSLSPPATASVAFTTAGADLSPPGPSALLLISLLTFLLLAIAFYFVSAKTRAKPGLHKRPKKSGRKRARRSRRP